MENMISKEEIDGIVKSIIDDYDSARNIDKIDIYSSPDRSRVHELINSLFKIVYPGFFRDRSYKIYNPNNSFGVIIEDTFYHLRKQIFLALDYGSDEDYTDEQRINDSYRICKAFFEKIPKIREYLETDLLATLDGDPAACSFEEIILSYPGIMAITTYRLAHELYVENVPLLPRLMTEFAHSKTGIDIHPGATIGKFFFIDHGTGIVIGETSVIGENVKIYQGVTIGALSTKGGRKLSGKKRHPTICDNVTIYAGASILGGDTVIGENTIIGGNTFITSSVDANMVVSMKDLEMDLRTSGKNSVSGQSAQGDSWYYVI